MRSKRLVARANMRKVPRGENSRGAFCRCADSARPFVCSTYSTAFEIHLALRDHVLDAPWTGLPGYGGETTPYEMDVVGTEEVVMH